jgi:hypothetical protein
MARQCPFDLIDDDLISLGTIDRDELVVGAMRYETIICGCVKWMHPSARRQLEAFAAAGGKVLCVNHGPGCHGLPEPSPLKSFNIGSALNVAQDATPLITIVPPCRDVRVAARQLKDQRMVVVFNEGQSAYRGAMAAAGEHVSELDLMTGAITRGEVEGRHVALDLGPGETRAYYFSRARAGFASRGLVPKEGITIDPAEVRAVSGRQIVAGEHDFEIRNLKFENVPLIQSAVWKTWLGEDYSGEVDYEFVLNMPADWNGSLLQLETGPLEYAATVLVDRQKVGHLLWSPWRVILPKCNHGPHTITIRVANTLANELTSDRVSQAWAQKQGPGWPSPYHKRALEFERESRGGSIAGPIQLTRLANDKRVVL